MAHRKYLTEGIILQIFDQGEAGKTLSVLTPDYGLIRLVATGVREMKSKMRGSFDVLNYGEWEFVEGKEVKRLVGVFLHESYFKKFLGEENNKEREKVSKVLNFMNRIIVGETENENLYDIFMGGLDKVFDYRDKLEEFEILWVIQILSALGYWEVGDTDSFVEQNFAKVFMDKEKYVQKINESIKSTQL
jgi:DNA repair protein RecO